MAIRRHRRIDQPIEDLATHPHPLMTVKVLAEFLECSERTITRMLEGGSLPGDKVGREWRMPTAGIRAAFPALAQPPGFYAKSDTTAVA